MVINKIISLLLLILFSPLLVIVSLVIIIDDGFPVIFKQNRVGKNNSPFWIYKFRTMNTHTPDVASHLMKQPHKYFITTGHLFRKLSIDELPQLFNILKGDMVFIGPRPALFNQEDLINLRTQNGIHKLNPGVTGWAQVNGRDEMTITEKLQYEKYYLDHRSFYLNKKIIIMTLKQIFFSKGVSH